MTKPYSKPQSSCACGHDHSDGPAHGRSLAQLRIAALGGVFVLNSYWFDGFTSSLSALIGAIILSIPIFVAAFNDLRSGQIRMNELVAIAILAAIALGDHQSAGIIAFFLLLTIVIENKTASGAHRAIEGLIRLTPHQARRINPINGSESEALVAELHVGDLIIVRPGENFPVDGVVVSGCGAVNQATITGESIPTEKTPGDDLFAGTQNLTGALTVRVTKVGDDTTLGQVKAMILAAEETKPPVVRMIDRYASYYTPMVLMLAALVWWFTSATDGAMERVITMLVISCPCAVVLATPTAVVATIAAAARLGILIKNVADLEVAAKIRSFIFDKTGTLTEGALAVAQISPVQAVQPAQLILAAASAEATSNHPVARALIQLANEVDLPLSNTTDFQEFHGLGVQARIADKIVRVGRADWLNQLGIPITLHPPPHEGVSVVYVAHDLQLLGWIAFQDKIRPDAASAINRLRALGINRIAMVTGDRQSVAASVAETLQITEFLADQLPEGKVSFVQAIAQNTPVAVVGDGINDAPALATGTLGIAMGAAGSDIAIHSASIALMNNDLRRIPALIILSRKMSAVVNQNLLLGFAFVLGGMILSVFGYLTPVWAAVIHTCSTLIIIINSARLIRIGEELKLNTIPINEDY